MRRPSSNSAPCTAISSLSQARYSAARSVLWVMILLQAQ